MSDAITPLPRAFSSFPAHVAVDVATVADKWSGIKARFGESMTGLCCLLASCLNKSLGHAIPGDFSVEGIGICRNCDDVLVLNVAQTLRHVGDAVVGEDWDATTCHTLRYSVRRDGDRLIIRQMRRSEHHGEGGTGIIGWHLPNQGELVVRVWESLLA